jgi:probable F420-dependent oxidoreductase
MLVPLLEAAAALGMAPASVGGVGDVPAERVDIVARGIVALMRRGGHAGRVFHLVQPEPLRLAELFGALRRAGHRLDPMEPDRWWQQLEKYGEDPAVRPLVCMGEAARYLVGADPDHRAPRFLAEASWAARAEAGVDAEPLDATFLDRLIATLTLPSPRGGEGSGRPAAAGDAARGGPGPAPDPTTASVRIDGMIAPIAFETDGRFPDSRGAAAACEAAGYGAFWAPEQRHDPLLALAAAAGSTTSIELGTAVVIALARSPMTVAYSAHDLHAQCGGRLILGLGPQIKLHLDHRFSMPSDRRVARMREFVAALKAIWGCWNHGRPLAFRGEFYTHTLMGPYFQPPPNPHGSPRVFLAASGPKMAELAGEIADGMIAPPYTDRRFLSEELLPAIERGLARSGRAREPFTVVCLPLVVTGRTPGEHAQVEARVRSMLAMWGSTGAYQRVFDPHGLDGLRDQLFTLSLSGAPDRWQRMADLIDDETLNLFATVAAPERLGSELRRRFGGLADRIILPAPHGAEADLWDPARLRLADADPRVRARTLP